MEKHNWKDYGKSRGPGRPPAQPSLLPWEHNVHCQQMVWTGSGSAFWYVYPAQRLGNGDELASMDDACQKESHGTCQEKEELRGVWDRVEAQLDKHRVEQCQRVLAPAMDSRYPIYFSPWIDKTGWVAYLAGYDLPAVAQLLESPDQQNEPGLHAMMLFIV
jgi:hypothetical protein